jgi:hypothetical protein
MALGGSVAAPARTIDVSALSGWLTLRAVENQAKRLQTIERAAPKAEPPATASTPAPAGTVPPLSPPPLAPATPLAQPTVDPARLREQAPALPPPLSVAPYPGATRPARPEVSVGPQN